MAGPETGELSADELEALAGETIRRDRAALFVHIDPIMRTIARALQALPFKDAQSPILKCQEVMNILCDPLGEHMGTCELCEEPVFAQGKPEDDVCSASEDGGWAHRSCMDALQKSNPELFRNAEEDHGDGD